MKQWGKFHSGKKKMKLGYIPRKVPKVPQRSGESPKTTTVGSSLATPEILLVLAS